MTLILHTAYGLIIPFFFELSVKNRRPTAGKAFISLPKDHLSPLSWRTHTG